MTTSPCSSGGPSEGTIEIQTGAILLREGARAVGSTYTRRPWDSDPEPVSAVPSSPQTPSALRALPAMPSPSSAPPSPPAIPPIPSPIPALDPLRRAAAAARPSSRRSEPPVISVPWSFAGAFALGATIAALAGLVLDRGAVEIAALASAVAGGMTLSAALARVASKGRAGRRRGA